MTRTYALFARMPSGESQLVSLETSEQSARQTVAANPQPGCDHYCLHQWQGVPTWGRWTPVYTILKPELSRDRI